MRQQNLERIIILAYKDVPFYLIVLISCDKRYFMIDQQIARHFLQYSDCLSNPPSLLFNSNN